MSLRVFGYLCLSVITGAILLVASLIAYWSADRRLPAEVVSTEVLTPVVKPGGKLMIRQKIRYTRECAAHVDRVLYDDKNHRKFLADVDYARPPRGIGTFEVVFVEDVPSYFEPGPATYRAIPVYSCNLVHQYLWSLTRNETVIPFRVEGTPF